MIDYRITKARIADIPEIGALITYCWKNSYKNIIDKSYLNTLHASERIKFLTYALISGSFLCDCAYIDKEIIGVSLYRTASVKGLAGYGELSCLYVDNSFQNNGIGERLLHIAENYMRGIGLNYVVLNVLKDNSNAVEFYRKRGFTAMTENQIKLGEKYYPFLLMRKKLN